MRGREVVGAGAGGDKTIYMDALAEEVAVRHLEAAHRDGRRFQLISEELGRRDFGGREVILVDPLDGSYNAKQGLPYYAVVLAVTAAERLGEVSLGYVLNLVTGDEFVAERGAGAYLNRERLLPQAAPTAEGSIGLLQLDAPAGVNPRGQAQRLIDRAERLRQMGSAALNLCHTATGGISLQVAPSPVRAFDLAGPLLILSEAGGIATDLAGGPLSAVSCDLESRTTLMASAFPDVHRRALQWLAGEP
jgi:myo-inositol-1(or 4)-monophosphatase